MKVICIWKNFGNDKKNIDSTCFYLKPETAVLLRNRPFYYPEYTKNIEANVELVLRVNKVGKYISEKFANTYYDEIGIGICLTAIDLQNQQIAAGQPWDISYSFDNSAPLSNFINRNKFADMNNISFSMSKNDKFVQKGNTGDLLNSFDKIISHISQYIMIKTGDLIFTGAIAKGIKIKIGDRMECFIDDESMLKCNIK